MSLSEAKNRKIYDYVNKDTTRDFAVGSNQTLYAGAIVGIDTNGYAVEAIASKRVVGIAIETAKNTGTTIDTRNRVVCQAGHIERFAYTGKARATNINRSFYAIADDAVTITASTNNYLGTCVDFELSKYVYIRVLAGKI